MSSILESDSSNLQKEEIECPSLLDILDFLKFPDLSTLDKIQWEDSQELDEILDFLNEESSKEGSISSSIPSSEESEGESEGESDISQGELYRSKNMQDLTTGNESDVLSLQPSEQLSKENEEEKEETPSEELPELSETNVSIPLNNEEKGETPLSESSSDGETPVSESASEGETPVSEVDLSETPSEKLPEEDTEEKSEISQ